MGEKFPCTAALRAEGTLSPRPFTCREQTITNSLMTTGYMSMGSIRPFLMYIIVAQGQCSKCTLKRSQNELFWSTLVQECPLLSCLWVLSLWDDSVNYESGLLSLSSWPCSLLFFSGVQILLYVEHRATGERRICLKSNSTSEGMNEA